LCRGAAAGPQGGAGALEPGPCRARARPPAAARGGARTGRVSGDARRADGRRVPGGAGVAPDDFPFDFDVRDEPDPEEWPGTQAGGAPGKKPRRGLRSLMVIVPAWSLGGCGRAHLSSQYGQAYAAWFNVQHARSKAAPDDSRRVIESLDAGEAG